MSHNIVQIFVDVKAEVILLPIYGYLVPFHISIVKNASKTDDYLRINFVTPTQITAQSQVFQLFDSLLWGYCGVLTKPQAGGKEVLYVREVTYRIQDQKSLTNSLRLIKELRKRVSDRENAAREQSGLISQDKLILSKNRNPRLADLFIRPSILLFCYVGVWIDYPFCFDGIRHQRSQNRWCFGGSCQWFPL